MSSSGTHSHLNRCDELVRLGFQRDICIRGEQPPGKALTLREKRSADKPGPGAEPKAQESRWSSGYSTVFCHSHWLLLSIWELGCEGEEEVV